MPRARSFSSSFFATTVDVAIAVPHATRTLFMALRCQSGARLGATFVLRDALEQRDDGAQAWRRDAQPVHPEAEQDAGPARVGGELPADRHRLSSAVGALDHGAHDGQNPRIEGLLGVAPLGVEDEGGEVVRPDADEV